MTLNEFRTKELIWDRATKRIYDPLEANSGDSNGRKLAVQVLDGGVITDLTGTQLYLSWKTKNNTHKGLDAFKAVNPREGIFEIAYTPGMLSNVGDLNASLVLIDNVGRVESNLFRITVSQSNVVDDSVVSEDSFTALTEALVKVNDLEGNYAPRLNELTAQLAQTMSQTEFDSWVATLLDGGPSIFFENLSALEAAYPNGASGVALVRESDPARIYVWNPNANYWQDYGEYQGIEVKDGTIEPRKTTFFESSKNLFYGNYVTGVLSSLGQYRSDGENGRIAMVEIEPNKTYTIKVHEPEKQNRFIVSVVNSKPIFGEEYKNADYLVVYNTPLSEYTFTNISNGRYVLIYVSSENQEPKLQIEEGEHATSYDDGIPKIPKEFIERAPADVKASDFINFGKNKTIRVLSDIVINEERRVDEASVTGYSHLAILEHGKQYTIKKYEGGNRFRVALLEEYPRREKLPFRPDHVFMGPDNPSEELEYSFFNSNYNYALIFTNSYDNDIPLVQVEEGNEATEYEALQWGMFGEKLNDILTTGKNKFDGNYTKEIYIGVDTVDEIDNPGARCAVVPIERWKNYTLKKYKGGDRLRVAIVDKFPSKDVLPLKPLFYRIMDDVGEEEYEWTFLNDYGNNRINYLLVYTNRTLEETPLIQVEEGKVATDYENYELKYLEKPLSLNVEENSIKNDNQYFILDDIQGIYDSPDLPSVAAGQSFDLRASLHTAIYSIYDEMVSDYPDYINRSLLGHDTIGNPIYSYRFLPQTADSNTSLRRPKLIITSGLHGDEKMTVWALVQFLKDMCENWQDNNILEFIRWNFEIIVIPTCNPSGYDLNQRQNINGVDLNRNFPYYWRETDEGINYSGPSPASEVETQILVDFINNNTDVDYLIDFHNFYMHDDYIMWLPTNNPVHKQIGMNVISTLSRKWKQQYSYFPKDKLFGFINSNRNATFREYAESLGIKSTTLESVHKVTYGDGRRQYDAVTTNCAVDVIGNYLTAIGKSIK